MELSSGFSSQDPATQFSKILATLESLQSSVNDIHDRIRGLTKDFYTVEEVAEATGRAEYTVRDWIRKGWLHASRVEGTGARGRLLIPRDELKRLVSNGKATHMPEIIVHKEQ